MLLFISNNRNRELLQLHVDQKGSSERLTCQIHNLPARKGSLKTFSE